MIYDEYLFTPFLFDEKESLSLGNILQIIGPQVFFFILYLTLFSFFLSIIYFLDPTLKTLHFFTDLTLKDIILENYVDN